MPSFGSGWFGFIALEQDRGNLQLKGTLNYRLTV
jgi:hypothetical protein